MFVLQATGNKAYSWYLFHVWTGQEVDLNCVKKAPHTLPQSKTLKNLQKTRRTISQDRFHNNRKVSFFRSEIQRNEGWLKTSAQHSIFTGFVLSRCFILSLTMFHEHLLGAHQTWSHYPHYLYDPLFCKWCRWDQNYRLPISCSDTFAPGSILACHSVISIQFQMRFHCITQKETSATG